ncbi:MAG: DUF3626 domain-containing protein [Pseudolabrys sp.]
MRERTKAQATLDEIAVRASIARGRLDGAIAGFECNARVVVHFHPDRFTTDGSTVAEALLREGRYRNQFETGISNGSLTGFAGGDRDRWEAGLFGNAYRAAAAGERPKYGALDCLGYSDGAVPFFGSCYLVLHGGVFPRCTFTFGDSCEAECAGVVGEMHSVAAAMMKFVEDGHSFTGDRMTIDKLIARLARRSRSRAPASRRLGRILEHYVEAQVHGPIELARDVAALVADPSYCGTSVGRVLAAMCDRHRIPLRWHAGYSLPAASVPDDFQGPLFDRVRGARMPALAQRVAQPEGVLDAAIIGRAVAALDRRAGKLFDEAVKDLNHLWYLLVQFGVPRSVKPGRSMQRAGGAIGVSCGPSTSTSAGQSCPRKVRGLACLA